MYESETSRNLRRGDKAIGSGTELVQYMNWYRCLGVAINVVNHFKTRYLDPVPDALDYE